MVLAAVLAGLGLLAIAAMVVARPPSRTGTGDRELHKLAEGVYVYRGVFACSGVFVLPTAVLVIDTQVTPSEGERMRRKIAAVTPLPIKYVVNTHYHGDHAGGNAAFPDAEIIATEETAQLLVERDSERVEYADTFGLAFQEVHAIRPPTRTFRDRLELDIGGERIEVVQLGPTETPDACVVWWPSRRAIASGDGVCPHDYPWTGVPFLDEGLQPDGQWVAFLQKVKELRPVVLIPGHGPSLVGERVIARRLELLSNLFTNLFASVRKELDAGRAPQDVVAEVNGKLRRYSKRADLRERVTSQPFAIYKAINGLTPSRRGRGWWRDLRPSIVRRAPRELAERELAGCDLPHVVARAESLAATGQRPLALAMLEAWTSTHPGDAAASGLLSELLVDGMVDVLGKVPHIDAMEYLSLATRHARAALAIDPRERRALLTLGTAEVWGGMVLAQPMNPAIEKLTAALAGRLRGDQRRRTAFLLGKAHQIDGRDAESDRWYREALPGWARFLFPLVRARLRVTP